MRRRTTARWVGGRVSVRTHIITELPSVYYVYEKPLGAYKRELIRDG